MNLFGWVLLLAAVLATAGDGVAVARRSRGLGQLARPAVVVILLAFAWLVHADEISAGRWLLLALVLGLVSDVLLLGPNPPDERFSLGLVGLLLAHLACLGALVAMAAAPPIWLGVLLPVIALVAAWRWGLRPLLRRERGGGTAVTAYAVVLLLVTTVALWRGQVLVAAGLTLFCVSSLLLGWSRFSRHRSGRGREVAVHLTSHLAQLMVVLGVLRPDLLG